MPQKVSQKLEQKIQQLAQKYVPETVQGFQPFFQPRLAQMRISIQEKFPELLHGLEEYTIQQQLEKNLLYAISGNISRMISKEEATESMVEVHREETPEETEIQPDQQPQAQYVKIEHVEDDVNFSIQSALLSQSNVQQNNTVQQLQPVTQNLGQVQNQASQHNEPVPQPNVRGNIEAPRMIQTQLEFIQKAKRGRTVKWPLPFRAKERLAKSCPVTRQIAKENRIFGRRLLRLANKEVKNYRYELIQELKFDQWKNRSHPKITSYIVLRQQESQEEIGPMIDLQQQLNNHGSIEVGNVTFTFVLNNNQDFEFTDYTFNDRSYELKRRELLGLKKQRFLTRVTELLPMKRKQRYDLMFAKFSPIA